MWKRIRIGFLLLILAGVALETWRNQTRATAWRDTLHVALYPINADGGDATAAYIAQLDHDSFAEIETFFAEQAQAYGVHTLRPVRISLQAPLQDNPPPPPRHANALQAIVWSLHLRGWAWRQPRGTPPPTVRLFVRYWNGGEALALDSVGLHKGMIGVINVFGQRAMTHANAVVIAHELLHTLGASDKYDPQTLMPLDPEGYADPQVQPRWPQSRCEVMAGRIALDAAHAVQAPSLAQCVIGPATAAEVGLRRAIRSP